MKRCICGKPSVAQLRGPYHPEPRETSWVTRHGRDDVTATPVFTGSLDHCGDAECARVATECLYPEIRHE